MRNHFLLLIAASSLLVAGCHTTNHAARWEYRTTSSLDEVNKLADQGWTVVNFAIPQSGPHVYLLKRAKPAPGSNDLAHAQESQVKPNVPSLRLNFATEDAGQTHTKIEIRTEEPQPKVIRKIDNLRAASTNMPLSEVPDGKYFVFLSSPDYAPQWRRFTLKQEQAEPDTINVKLFRKRYVVLRYVFNTSGGREFSGKDIQEGRAAVSHWGSLPYFQQDWQIWQKSSPDELFGETPYLEFHRFSDGFGFARAPEGVSFDDLKEAPDDAEYKCRNTKAEKGLMLLCRIEGNRKDGLGYGKVVVEDVTETPPPGVKVIESP